LKYIKKNIIMNNDIKEVANIIKKSKYAIAFTGAGISVESGIPPFTGAGGLWEQYDPKFIELDFFYANPKQSWKEMRKIFFNSMGQAKPNEAHVVISELEQQCFIKGVITQNIDNLHKTAGSKNIVEFHGTINSLICIECQKKYDIPNIDISVDIPKCSCGGILKPNFVFYGEGINQYNYEKSNAMINKSDLVIIVGTAGQVMPAGYLPFIAKNNGATIIEVNTSKSAYTDKITDYYFNMKAGLFFSELKKYFT